MSQAIEIVATKDGSPTLRTAAGITYHSTHGAVQESMHVFIQTGLIAALEAFPEGLVTILEMGFGTGLNALLTALESNRRHRAIRYVSVEKYPVPEVIWQQLTYTQAAAGQALFEALHRAPWNEPVMITPQVELLKVAGELQIMTLPEAVQLIYFDAFAPEDAPELWTPLLFRKLIDGMVPGGILTTYCSKGVVRRALQEVGFLVEKLPGPPGKREIVRARKPE
ncbi:MAG: SAM-dependent methyltransferase [Sphingobacteriales bacterium]|nr:MAG: SAM-dependent methyltransferase [Sphingobacteriales bacterium]